MNAGRERGRALQRGAPAARAVDLVSIACALCVHMLAMPSALRAQPSQPGPGVNAPGAPQDTPADAPVGEPALAPPQGSSGVDSPTLDSGETAESGGADLDQLIEGVERLLAKSRADAARALAARDYPAALSALERAHELAPADIDVMLELANLLVSIGNPERADKLYRQVLAQDPEQAAAHLALADLIAGSGEDSDLVEAATHLTRSRELLGNRPDLILRQARVASRRGRFEEAARFYEQRRVAVPPDDEMRLELGDFYRDFGRPEDALQWYRSIGTSSAAGAGHANRSTPAAVGAAARRIFDLEVEREARRYGFARPTRAPSPALRDAIARARALSSEGEHERARILLEQAIEGAPTDAPARAALAEVLAAAGERDAAELAYLRALSLDPRPEIERALAELYLADADASRAAPAAALLRRVLASRPDWTELHLTLARALQRSGDLPGALLHARRFVARAEAGPRRSEAEALVTQLQRVLGGGLGGASGPAGDPADAKDVRHGEPAVLSTARAHLARGAVDAALAALRDQDDGVTSTEAMLLRARILIGAERLPEARETLERLIARDRHGAEAHALLGRVLLASRLEHERRAGRASLAEAERLGDGDASLELARLDLADDQGALSWLYDGPRVVALLHARERLQALARAGQGGARAEVEALAERTEQRLIALGAAACAVLALLLLILLLLRRRVWGGADLAELVPRAPEAGPELMTILSAIRHEVLKHNTMMLGGLCEALARAEDLPAAAEQAQHIHRALLAGGGAADRLEGYIQQLEQLGRAHGVRLNLARRDAAIGALLDGFAVLDSVDALLGKVARLSPRRRRSLLMRLGEASELLNVRAAGALRALLDSVRSLEVDAELLHEIHDRIAAEPALAERTIAPLALDPTATLPCQVRVPRQVFEDVLANLLRNALQAMIPGAQRGEGGVALAVGLQVVAGLDPITGLSEVCFRVRDRAPESLRDEHLRRRYVEAGLGITADLVSRYEGTLEVEPDEPGWAKAVVLRLPGEACQESES